MDFATRRQVHEDVIMRRSRLPHAMEPSFDADSYNQVITVLEAAVDDLAHDKVEEVVDGADEGESTLDDDGGGDRAGADSMIDIDAELGIRYDLRHQRMYTIDSKTTLEVGLHAHQKTQDTLTAMMWLTTLFAHREGGGTNEGEEEDR